MSDQERTSTKRGNGLLKLFSSLTVVIIVAKIAGFIKQMITASTFGATIDTDIISLADGFVSNADYLITQTLITALSTVYLHVRAKERERSEILVTDSLFATTLISFILSLLFICFAPFIARVIAPSYSGEVFDRLVKYLRIYSPQMILMTIIAIIHAVLNSHERFIPGNLIGFNQSIIMVISIVCLHSFLGINVLVLASYIYLVFNIVFLTFFAKKELRLRKGQFLKNPDLKKLGSMMIPLLIGYAMVFVNQQVDKIIVSGMTAGTVTSLHYAQVLSNIVTTLIGTFCTVLYTRITKQVSAHHIDRANITTEVAAKLLVTLLIPVSIVAFFQSDEIVSIVFGRGQFDAKAVDSASLALKGYSLCFIPFSLKSLYARYLYGNLNTKKPMINSTIGIVFNIIFSLILSKYIGVLGVTLASSISEMICCCLNMFSCKHHIDTMDFGWLKKCIVWWVVGSSISIVFVLICSHFIGSLNMYVRLALIALGAFCISLSITLPVYKKYCAFLKK